MNAPVVASVITTTPLVGAVTIVYVRVLFSTSEPVRVPLYIVSSIGVIDCAFATGTSLTALIFTTKSTLVVTTPSDTPKVNVSVVFAVKGLITASFGVKVYAPVVVVSTRVP